LDSLNENSSFPININEEENVDHNISENIIKDDKNSINELFNLFEDIEAEEDLTVKESPSINNGIYNYIFNVIELIIIIIIIVFIIEFIIIIYIL